MAHPDALGYLSDLNDEIALPWFGMVCDLAASGVRDFTPDDLDLLLTIFAGKACYLRSSLSSSAVAAKSKASQVDFLEILFAFTNFKLLGDTLRIDFKKRITLVFGTNGSGKSSLCEALRVLASPDAPLRPLQNVREVISAPTGFKFKFRSDASASSWTTVSSYGIKQATIC
ncbi:AAA family ATPase [Burkholderia alba]|uniref:AAA family ATPase n=1 Tax=Burkholderia alba TaxID=2683677 RepID=UPI002B0571E7|nr:AAA family ATPase [Burkholderia alba]